MSKISTIPKIVSIQVPEPSTQWTKTPARITQTATVTIEDKPVEVEETVVYVKDEKTVMLSEFYAEASTLIKTAPTKLTEDNLVTLEKFTDTYTTDKETVDLAAAETTMKQQGELGIGCPNCYRFHTLHPTADLKGWRSERVFNNKLACECGLIIELKQPTAPAPTPIKTVEPIEVVKVP